MVDKELLFKPRLPEADIDIPGVGSVRVRGLTREEVLAIRKATDNAEQIDGPRQLVLERKVLSRAMVDPELTEAEVARWQRVASVGELQRVVDKVQELSGMTPEASKSDMAGAGA